MVASRRYVQHGILELAMLRANEVLKSDLAEVLEDIFTAKLGLALSGFGTVIAGWGKYLGLVELQLPRGVGVFRHS
ncbi:MAG TPA: hypothetical protein VKM54_28270 [Myxococcota bacterium]|nr:hypothetical protein [Myxococcota bacterium]